MSATNLGNQYLTFDYKHPSKAGDFNTLLREGVSPGVYSGGELAKIDDTTIEVSPFVAYLNVGTDKMLRAEARDSFEVAVSQSEPLIYMTYSWLETIENWLDFNSRGVADPPITNEVVLGTAVYSGSTIIGVDYEDKTWGNKYYTEYSFNNLKEIVESAGNSVDLEDSSNVKDAIEKEYASSHIAGNVIEGDFSSAPYKYVSIDGAYTVGNASSGATYAGAIYENLFNFCGSKYGNTGAEIFANGDVRFLPNKKFEWSNLRISTNYDFAGSAGILGGIQQTYGNMPVSSNLITLAAHKKYRISLVFRSIGDTVTDDASITIYDSTNAAHLSKRAVALNVTNATDASALTSLNLLYETDDSIEIGVYNSSAEDVTILEQAFEMNVQTIGTTDIKHWIRY